MNGLRLATSKCTRRAAATRSGYNITVSQAWGTRGIHRRRPLPYSIEEGLGNFLPPQALKVVAEEYQDGLLERLNEQIKDNGELAGKPIADVVIQTAPNRAQTLAFNYASLALNNSFFLDQLKPPPKPPHKTHEGEISNTLFGRIREDHGSLQNLISTFSAAASGVSTNGWLWFVCDTRGNTGILPTLGPGTLLIRSRTYLNPNQGHILGQLEDVGEDGIPTPSPLSRASPPGTSPSSPTSGLSSPYASSGPSLARYLHTSSSVANSPASFYDPSSYLAPSKVDLINVGEKLMPLFCVSLNEHAWLSAGYGVWGKEKWLKEFWTVLDWGKVSQMFDRHWTKNRQY